MKIRLPSSMLMRLPPSRPRRQPFEILYGPDQCPPAGGMIVQIIQHLVTVVPNLGYALLVAQICAMSAADTKNLIAGTLIAMGISTALNAWGGRLGGGALFVNIPNFDFMFIAPAAIAAAGLAGLAGEALIAALTCFALRPLLPRMRELLPPTVVGTVVCMAGIVLTVPAVKTSLGVDAAMRIDPAVACISLVSLATIVGVSVWGARRFKILAVIAGLVVGNLLTVFMGRMSLPEDFSSQPLFDAPQLIAPTLDLPLATLVGAVLISIFGQIYNLGCAVVMDKQTDGDWRRPDMRSAAGVFTANGIGDLIASFMGGIGTCISSSNLALASASRTVSRHIGLAIGLILMALAFLPKAVALVMVLLPLPVQGALQLYTAVFMFVGGIELTTSRAPSNRTAFILGISICAGIAVLIMPDIARHAPADLKLVVSNGYLVTGIVAFALNLIFRVGTGRTAECRFDDVDQPLADVISGFLESQGGQWQVRRDVLQRAISAAHEGAELISGSSSRSLQAISGRFDEFNLDIELRHSGQPINLSSSLADSMRAAEDFVSGAGDEASLDAVMVNAGGSILRHLADTVSSAAVDKRADQACLRLHFEH